MSRPLHLISSVAVVTLLGSTVFAATIRHDRNPQDYLDIGAFFTPVGRVDGVGTNSSGGTFNYIASGTLVAPDWVLTAAHVVDIAQSLSFTVNNTLHFADGWTHYP